jgi:PTH1 family peptidyl-tRNA hydrolase
MQAQLGSGNFWRLRLGIGHPGHKGEVAAFVLRKPPIDERIAVEQCISKSLDAVELMLKGDMAKALNQIHAKPQRPKPPRSAPAAGPDASDAAMAAPVEPSGGVTAKPAAASEPPVQPAKSAPASPVSTAPAKGLSSALAAALSSALGKGKP